MSDLLGGFDEMAAMGPPGSGSRKVEADFDVALFLGGSGMVSSSAARFRFLLSLAKAM